MINEVGIYKQKQEVKWWCFKIALWENLYFGI